MQSSKTNTTIYENLGKDTVNVYETAMSVDSHPMHVYETFKPQSQEQNDGIYENLPTNDEEIIKAEISNPACTVQPTSEEVIDSTENISTTT